jgi:hypothetical protein
MTILKNDFRKFAAWDSDVPDLLKARVAESLNIIKYLKYLTEDVSRLAMVEAEMQKRVCDRLQYS